MDEAFEGVDLDALAAVIGLQREEVEDAEANGNSADAEALRTQLATLEREMQLERDIRLTQSIALANMADAGAIESVRKENEQEFNVDEDDEEDHEIMNTQERPATNDLNILSKLAGRYVSREAGQILLAQAETGQETWRYADQLVESPMPTDDCLICGDEREFCDTMTMPCEHVYCHDCIHELFNKSFQDEGLFPARCCRNQLMQQRGIEIFLTKEILDTHAEKAVEFGTTDRTYCYSKTCSAFIAPVNHNTIKGYARCAKCPRLTCLKCKKKHHGKSACSPDPAARALLALAHEEGWQRCGRCDFLIELNTGCYHITCRCGYEFCYLCTAPWKTCECVQWDEERLVQRAELVANREGRDAREVREVLREGHNCEHGTWQGCRGGRCDECGHNLPVYLYRCLQCRITVCRSCRHNRLR